MAELQASQKITKEVLARAHSPDSVDRIYNDKIQYRTLHLRPSSPPPSKLNARAARRRTREKTKEKKKQKPAPLSARERRSLGLYDIPKEGQKWDVYEPLNNMWHGYIRELLGADAYTCGVNTASKLSSAEFHGANVEIVRSRCPSRVGICGIVVRDRKFVMEVITKKKGLKVVPKEGTTFRVTIPLPKGGVEKTEEPPKTQVFVFDILGDQMMLRSADRANRKFKSHFLKDL